MSGPTTEWDCPGCGKPFLPDLYDDEFDAIAARERHESRCVAYRDHRVTESLEFFARLDAERSAR